MQRIKTVFTLAVVGMCMLGLSTAALGADKFEKELEKEKEAVDLVRQVQQGGYDVITAEDLKNLIDSGKDIVIIDTMPYKAYKEIHVPGAKQFLFPIPTMATWDTKATDGKTEKDYEALLGADKGKTIIIYCGFVKCTRSHNGAIWAKKLGYRNVWRFAGGIFAWQGAKYPTGSAK